MMKNYLNHRRYLMYTFNQLQALVQKHEDPDLANLKFTTLYRFIRGNKDYVGHSNIPHITCECVQNVKTRNSSRME